jgi:hypothetical protein
MIKTRWDRIVWVFIYLSIFINSFVFFQTPFEFYFGYLIYIVLLPVFFRRYKLPVELVYIFIILIAVGVLNVELGNNQYKNFIKVGLGVIMSYSFYYFVVQESNINVKKLFEYYLFGSFIICVIGIVQVISFKVGFSPGYNFRWVLNKWGITPGGIFGIRMNSIFAEPSHFAEVISAAMFVAVRDLFVKEKYYFSSKQSLVVIIAYLLTYSSTGYIALFVTMVLFMINFGLVRYILVVIPLLFFVFNFIYDNASGFQIRVDSQIELFQGGEINIGKHHGSSIIQYNNFHVSVENIKEFPFFGTGLGSHEHAFEKHSLTKNIATEGFSWNSKDANSMLFRLMSETGLFGVFLMFFVIFKFYVNRPRINNDLENPYWLISNAILVMIVIKLVRQGHYFLNGFPFFIMLYYYSWLLNKKRNYELENSEHELIIETSDKN